MIITTRKYGDKVFLFDDEDQHIVDSYRWYAIRANKNSDVFYTRTHVPKADGTRATVCASRLFLASKLAPGLVVDHINHDGMDNRKSNLRICTHAENMRNRSRSKNASNAYKGVRKTGSGKFQAVIGFNNKLIPLGSYSTEEDAAKVYNMASKLLHGVYGHLNKVIKKTKKTIV